MDDLISRQALIDAIKKWKKEAEPEEAQVMDDIICLIEDQPPAYSVEAVVRELEGKSNGFFVNDEELGEMFVKTIPLPLAIEIVKRGGRNEID